MPRSNRKKVTKENARLAKSAGAPRDIGDPAKARGDTLKWLKGEGPAPEHFSLLFPDDEEALNDYKKDLWVHPERAKADAFAAYQFIAEAGDGMKDLLKSDQIRLNAEKVELSTRVTALKKKIAPYVDGQSSGGRATAEPHKQDQERYTRILGNYYQNSYKGRDRAQRVSYRQEAGRLLTQSGIKWTDPDSGKELPPPQEDRLRKFILPPLLRDLFPHLYSS